MLSQYELDRLDNIARNKAKLQALGLDGGLTSDPKDKPPKARPHSKSVSDDDDVREPVPPVRRSSRHTASATYCELTAKDMLLEERESLRPKRVIRAVNRFEDRQAEKYSTDKNAPRRSEAFNDTVLLKRNIGGRGGLLSPPYTSSTTLARVWHT
eukprot:2788546-Prymnesium_polylepis.1